MAFFFFSLLFGRSGSPSLSLQYLSAILSSCLIYQYVLYGTFTDARKASKAKQKDRTVRLVSLPYVPLFAPSVPMNINLLAVIPAPRYLLTQIITYGTRVLVPVTGDLTLLALNPCLGCSPRWVVSPV
ncbi:hypothetical protein HOY82DRAFT_543433 [Tuber indicum]|nr:hypothetical protein HOY82DRAFT_543433 [Tuber indicum]